MSFAGRPYLLLVGRGSDLHPLTTHVQVPRPRRRVAIAPGDGEVVDLDELSRENKLVKSLAYPRNSLLVVGFAASAHSLPVSPRKRPSVST